MSPLNAKTLMQTGAGYQPRTGNSGPGDGPMPMPTPHTDEKRDDFVARCMKDPATQDITGANADETQARRGAACERIFDDAKKEAEVDAAGFGMKIARDVASIPEEGKVRAVVATLGEIDNDGDVILPGAIDDGMKLTGSSWNHDTVHNRLVGNPSPDAPPVAKGVLRIEGNKAVAYLDYFMDTQRGSEAFKTLKALGPDACWSFAYHYDEKPQRATGQWAQKGARRVLTKLGPFLDGAMEVSPVKMPANSNTGTLSAKAAETAEARVSATDAGTKAAVTASVDGTEHPAEHFAYVPDPEKPSTWKLPIFDKIHAQEAIDRFDQVDIPESELTAVRARVLEAARKFGIEVSPKDEIKKPVKSAIDAQLEARIPRVKRLIGLE